MTPERCHSRRKAHLFHQGGIVAVAHWSPWEVKMELDHEETGKVVGLGGGATATSIAAVLASLGFAGPWVAIVAGAIALHLAWQLPLIASRDKGNGVWLVMPWPGGPALPPPLGAIVIPYTRYAPDNSLWSSKPDSTIGSTDGDVIEVHIEPIDNAEVVVFVLNNQVPSGWDKAMVLRDGLGGEWWLQAKGHNRIESGLYSSQLGNGQHITFFKPKTFGHWTEMFSVNGLEQLQPGSRVIFTWVDDDGP